MFISACSSGSVPFDLLNGTASPVVAVCERAVCRGAKELGNGKRVHWQVTAQRRCVPLPAPGDRARVPAF
jgi:hypothetical protein